MREHEGDDLGDWADLEGLRRVRHEVHMVEQRRTIEVEDGDCMCKEWLVAIRVHELLMACNGVPILRRSALKWADGEVNGMMEDDRS